MSKKRTKESALPPYKNASIEAVKRPFESEALKPYHVRALRGISQINETTWQVNLFISSDTDYTKVKQGVDRALRSLAINAGMCINGCNIIKNELAEYTVVFISVLGKKKATGDRQ